LPRIRSSLSRFPLPLPGFGLKSSLGNSARSVAKRRVISAIGFSVRTAMIHLVSPCLAPPRSAISTCGRYEFAVTASYFPILLSTRTPHPFICRPLALLSTFAHAIPRAFNISLQHRILVVSLTERVRVPVGFR